MPGESVKTAVVTGGARGIGLATVKALLRDGWRVHGWDMAPGGLPDVTWTTVEVTDPGSVAAAAAGVERCSLLANVAGIAPRGVVSEVTPAAWRRPIDVNLLGTFHCCQALHGALVRAGGVVVNVGSIRGFRSGINRSAYAVSKAGVHSLTSALGVEWGPEGVRVVGIAPGFVRTERVANSIEAGYFLEDAVKDKTPLGRLAEPDELANAIVALAGPTFAFMTATTLLFDGGWSATDHSTDLASTRK